MSDERLKDDDIPIVNSESIQSEEAKTGHGFWGNGSMGYIYDDDLKKWSDDPNYH